MSDQLIPGLVAGLTGGGAVLLLALLKRPVKCEKCGVLLPKVRKPQNSRQALWGGYTCPQCGSELDRRGRIVRA
jgi:Zn finger protein HypA/HybF involved in hydrogenase expression